MPSRESTRCNELVLSLAEPWDRGRQTATPRPPVERTASINHRYVIDTEIPSRAFLQKPEAFRFSPIGPPETGETRSSERSREPRSDIRSEAVPALAARSRESFSGRQRRPDFGPRRCCAAAKSRTACWNFFTVRIFPRPESAENRRSETTRVATTD